MCGLLRVREATKVRILAGHRLAERGWIDHTVNNRLAGEGVVEVRGIGVALWCNSEHATRHDRYLDFGLVGRLDLFVVQLGEVDGLEERVRLDVVDIGFAAETLLGV